MAQLDKILQAILYGRQDQNLRFTDLTRVITALGFTERIKGSHHIYTHPDVEEIINLQPATGGKAKPYQVKQCRTVITKYRLGLDP